MNNNNNECNYTIEEKNEENANGIDVNLELPIIITSSASCCSDTDLLSQPNGTVSFNNETSFINYNGNSTDQLSFMRTPSPSNLNTSGTSRGVRTFIFQFVDTIEQFANSRDSNLCRTYDDGRNRWAVARRPNNKKQ